MSLIQLLKFTTWETRLFQMPRFETPRFQTGTSDTVAFGRGQSRIELLQCQA